MRWTSCGAGGGVPGTLRVRPRLMIIMFECHPIKVLFLCLHGVLQFPRKANAGCRHVEVLWESLARNSIAREKLMISWS